MTIPMSDAHPENPHQAEELVCVHGRSPDDCHQCWAALQRRGPSQPVPIQHGHSRPLPLAARCGVCWRYRPDHDRVEATMPPELRHEFEPARRRTGGVA